MQQAMDAGLAAVEQKIALRQNEPIPAPAEPEKDDGHVETVEEVKLKMAAVQQ